MVGGGTAIAFAGGPRRPRLLLLAAWLLSRAALLVALVAGTTMVLGDVVLYQGWVRGMTSGHGLPVHDERWQYPPGAAVVLLIAGLEPRYMWGLVGVVFVADAAVFFALLRGQSPLGAAVWVVGPSLLGPLTYARFDVVPTAFAVCGLLWGRRPVLAGAALAIGGWVKVWPVLLLGALRDRRAVPGALLGAAVASIAVVLALAATGQLGAATAFLAFQQARGLQVESVAATPFMVARAFGIGPPPVYQYGAMEVATAGRDVAVAVCTAGEAMVLVFFAAAALRAWRRPPPAAGPQAAGPPTAGQAGADRALALVLGLMVTSRVLSPQYLLWALGLAATAVAMGSRRQWTTAVLLLVAAAASHLVYPVLYSGVLSGRPLPTGVLVVRNLLLIAATVSAVRGARVHAAKVARPSPAEDVLVTA